MDATVCAYGDTVPREYGSGAWLGGDGSGAPPAVDLAGSVEYLAAGGSATCAVMSGAVGAPSRIKCFGQNRRGQLGRGNTAVAGNSAASMGVSLEDVSLPTGFTMAESGKVASSITISELVTPTAIKADRCTTFSAGAFPAKAFGACPVDGGAIGTCGIPLIVSDVVASLAVVDEFNGQIDQLASLTASVDLTSAISTGGFAYRGIRYTSAMAAAHIGRHYCATLRTTSAGGAGSLADAALTWGNSSAGRAA